MRATGAIRGGVLALVAVLASGCATTSRQYVAAGDGTICSDRPLGVVAVLPETAWRADQKDVAERTEMAHRAITEALAALPCGRLAEPGGVRDVEPWSARSEAGLTRDLAARGIDSAVLVRVEELTPRLTITLSLPFLWSGASEADFRVRVLETSNGGVVSDFRVVRSRGGPFQLRPASWSETELREALIDALGPS